MKKILVVDDNEFHLTVAEAILKKKYEVIPVKSGKEALDLFLHKVIPDLILLDIVMPNLDGWETFNRIKAISLLRDVPIAFLTSLTESAEVEHAQEIGAIDYITKPYKVDDFLDRVEKILKRSGSGTSDC